MVQNSTKPVIDFTHYITERTDRFSGREWLFQIINDWLADTNSSRFLLLTGKPGSGKTAIASRLSQFACGTVLQPDGLTQLKRNFLSAIHFCSARDRRWIDPHVFAESLAMQLAARYPAYAKALIKARGDRQIVIEVEQSVQEVREGQVIGVVINRLDVSGVLAEDAFSRIVREPLETLFHGGFDEQVIIIVDALDEALHYSGNMSIISLLDQINNLPPRVRFLLTSRLDERVENTFRDVNRVQISSGNFDQYNQEDIRRYFKVRLDDDLSLVRQAAGLPAAQVIELAEAISLKAEGNFLYVHFLLDAMARGQRQLTEINGLPEELDSLYFVSLQRLVKLGKRDWLNDYAPLVGILSVAQESLTLCQLMSFTRASESAIWRYLGDLQQFIEEVDPNEEHKSTEKRYRLYHQSVIDFLRRRSLGAGKNQLRNSYYLPADEWHTQIVDHYRAGAASWASVDWSRVDDYGLRYLLHHLFSVEENKQLVDLLRGTFLITKAQQLGSYRSILDDLLLGTQAAVRQSNFPILLHFMLIYVGLKQRVCSLPVEEIIPLYAAVGQVNRAVELAKLIDTGWRYSSTMRAIVDALIRHDRSKALEVAKLIDDPEYRAEAYINILQAVLTEREEITDFGSLLDDTLDIVEHSKDPHWRSHKLWHLAEILRLIDFERAKSLIEQAIEVARSIDRDQWSYKNLRLLAQTVSNLDRDRGIQLYQEAIAAVERMDEGEWKGKLMGEIFGDLAVLNADLAIMLAGKTQSVVGKPFALAHLAAHFGRSDQQRAASLVLQSLNAAKDITLKIGKHEAERWRKKATATIAWAMARFDLEAALVLLDNTYSDARDVALSNITQDLFEDTKIALKVANKIQSLETRSQALADLASTQLEQDIESSLAIISQIQEPMQHCRILTDVGIWLLSHADKRGDSFIDRAIDLASSQDGSKKIILLSGIAIKLRIQDRQRSAKLRRRAVESVLAGWNTDQSLKVLIQIANLCIQEGDTVSALALLRKAAQYSQSDVYKQDWLIDSQAVLLKELARYDLAGTFTFIDSLPASVQPFMLPGVITILAQNDLDQALRLFEKTPIHKVLAPIILAAANQNSSETVSLAERLWCLDGEIKPQETDDTLAQASAALAQYNLRSAKRLLNKVLVDFLSDTIPYIGKALISIAKRNQETALKLIPKVVSAVKRQASGNKEENLSVLYEAIACFAPDTALALIKESRVDPGYRSKVLSSIATSVAKKDPARATSILSRAIEEASKSRWKWLTIEAFLVAALRVMEWDRSKMEELISQALNLAKESPNTLSRGEDFAQAARIYLLADQVDRAIPLLHESIELMRFDSPGMVQIDVLEAITKAFDLCSREVLIPLLPELLYSTLNAEDLLFQGMPLILPSFWRSSTTDKSETIRTLIREIEAAAQVIQEIFTG